MKTKKQEPNNDIFADIVFLIGLSSVGSGVWAIHPPSALIVVGIILILLPLVGALRNGVSKQDSEE